MHEKLCVLKVEELKSKTFKNYLSITTYIFPLKENLYGKLTRHKNIVIFFREIEIK